jgi:hypothetical protein
LHELQNQLKFNGLLKGKKVKKLMEFFVVFFFRKKITSRRISAGRSTGTVENHLTGIKFFLSEMSSDAVLRLETMGDCGDVIDRELQKGTRLPGTIRLYLTSLIRFLEWVSGHSAWLRHLRMSSNAVVSQQGTNHSQEDNQGGCQFRNGWKVSKMFKLFCIISVHEKKCCCI